MSNVVSFSAYRNDRRAQAEIKALADQTAQRLAHEVDQLADKLGGGFVADCLASAIVQAAQAAKPVTYQPAYCNPANETRGAKFDATRGLPLSEIAARIRADIKEAQKAARIEPGAKISVKTRTYSGGGSIDVRVTALPAGFRVTSDKYASWRKQFGDCSAPPIAFDEYQSDAARALLNGLNEIHSAYNRDNSDSMVDYFDCRFYGRAEIDGALRHALELAEVQASPGDYWAEGCDRP